MVAWELGAAGAFLTVDDVEVWALGEQRFRVVSAEDTQEVEGLQQARELAQQLACV
jgi:hypothetical protein